MSFEMKSGRPPSDPWGPRYPPAHGGIGWLQWELGRWPRGRLVGEPEGAPGANVPNNFHGRHVEIFQFITFNSYVITKSWRTHQKVRLDELI